MAQHELRATPDVLHGRLSRELPPVLTVAPGDTVRYELPDALWGIEGFSSPDADQRRQLAPADPARDIGHCVAGPVAVRGAKPGMVLSVTIGRISTATWGWTDAGGWPAEFSSRLGLADEARHRLLWQLDTKRQRATNQYGHGLPIRPFLGIMGLAPAAPGDHSTTPPQVTGGNLDCRELVTGSTLYLPVAVPQALFFCGDGHAAQGDGEVCGTAIETAIKAVDLAFNLHRHFPLALPFAETPAGWISFGFGATLDDAAFIATNAMLDWLCLTQAIDRPVAAALVSTAGSVRVTQLVNDICGVHLIFPPAALGSARRSAG